jgi:hypothetical protein
LQNFRSGPFPLPSASGLRTLASGLQNGLRPAMGAGFAHCRRALSREDAVTESKAGSKKSAKKGKASGSPRRDESTLPAGWPGRAADSHRQPRQPRHPEDETNAGGARGTAEAGGQQPGGPGSPPFERSDRANDGGSLKNR